MNKEQKAREFASDRHGAINQVRKYTGEPYITHPAAVVAILKSSPPYSVEMLCAGWLHDTIEDTDTTLTEIKAVFGSVVASLVWQVSDISKPSDGNRQVRKEIDRQHLAKASPTGKSIKLADMIDNLNDIVGLDPDFAKVYLVEKRQLLEVLEGGDPNLWHQAAQLLDQCDIDLAIPAIKPGLKQGEFSPSALLGMKM